MDGGKVKISVVHHNFIIGRSIELQWVLRLLPSAQFVCWWWRRLGDSSVFRALRTDNGIQAKQRPRNYHPRHDGATRSGALNWGLPPSFHHHTKPLRHRECGLNSRDRDRARGESAFFLFVVLVAAASFGAGSEVDADEIISISRYHIHKCFSEGPEGDPPFYS